MERTNELTDLLIYEGVITSVTKRPLAHRIRDKTHRAWLVTDDETFTGLSWAGATLIQGRRVEPGRRVRLTYRRNGEYNNLIWHLCEVL